MNHYVTGSTIKALREKQRLTQSQLAEKLCVSDKTISKWETRRGFPDISLLKPLACALQVSIPELLSGEQIVNTNRSANVLKSPLYICPICGNILHDQLWFPAVELPFHHWKPKTQMTSISRRVKLSTRNM